METGPARSCPWLIKTQTSFLLLVMINPTQTRQAATPSKSCMVLYRGSRRWFISFKSVSKENKTEVRHWDNALGFAGNLYLWWFNTTTVFAVFQSHIQACLVWPLTFPLFKGIKVISKTKETYSGLQLYQHKSLKCICFDVCCVL